MHLKGFSRFGTPALPGALERQEDNTMNSVNSIAPLVVICASLVLAMVFAGQLSF